MISDLCARCGAPVLPHTGLMFFSVTVGVKRFHFDCVREEDTIRTLREASA